MDERTSGGTLLQTEMDERPSGRRVRTKERVHGEGEEDGGGGLDGDGHRAVEQTLGGGGGHRGGHEAQLLEPPGQREGRQVVLSEGQTSTGQALCSEITEMVVVCSNLLLRVIYNKTPDFLGVYTVQKAYILLSYMSNQCLGGQKLFSFIGPKISSDSSDLVCDYEDNGPKVCCYVRDNS